MLLIQAVVIVTEDDGQARPELEVMLRQVAIDGPYLEVDVALADPHEERGLQLCLDGLPLLVDEP